MASLNERRSNPLDALFVGLRPLRHRAKTEKTADKDRETIVRVIPEVAADGSILPMVVGGGGDDLDYSSLTTETLNMYMGVTNKYTGWGQCSDVPNQREVDMIFPGLFIRAKGRSSKGELPDSEFLKFSKWIQRAQGKGEALSRPQSVALLQCVVLKYDGQVMAKPAVRQVLILSKMAKAALNRTLQAAHAAGRDLFHPATGCQLVFDSVAPDPNSENPIPTLTCSEGPVMPISEADIRQLWAPWETSIRRNTLEEHVKLAVRCYDRAFVETLFPEEVSQFLPPVQQQQVPQQAAPLAVQQAPAQQATQQPAAQQQLPQQQAPAAVALDLSNSVSLDSGDDDDDDGDVGGTAPASPAPSTGPAPGTGTPPDPDDLESQYAQSLLS